MIMRTKHFATYREVELFVERNKIAKENIQQIITELIECYGRAAVRYVLFYWEERPALEE